MQIIVVLQCKIDVNNLADYEAVNIKEAAENQRRWLQEGSLSVADILDNCSIISVEGEE